MDYDIWLLVATPPPGPELTALPAAPLLERAMAHTHDWPTAAQALALARSAVRVTEPLPSPERLPALLERVRATAARHPCVAVFWQPAERLLAPTALETDDPLRVACNLRLFHVEAGAADERVIDTLGLAPLGLPDVQCHFRGLDPQAVAALVDDTAHYLYSEGDLIEDEDTIEGLKGAPWRCRREVALVDPARDVLDLAPIG